MVLEKIENLFEKINKFHPESKGKIVAIEAESGNYFIGDSGMEAYKKARRKYPKKQFIFRRIGFKSTFFVGASE